MQGVNVRSFSDLRRRLEAVLGVETPLFRSLDDALARRDDARLGEALALLTGAPPDLRGRVETMFLDRLFDPDGASGLADLQVAGTRLH
jgi:hypothetical protein